MVVPQKKFANGKRHDSTKSFKPTKKPFKKTKDDVAARSEAMALQLDDVPDFPRGLFLPPNFSCYAINFCFLCYLLLCS